jgi:hypothetical protein
MMSKIMGKIDQPASQLNHHGTLWDLTGDLRRGLLQDLNLIVCQVILIQIRDLE